MTDTPADQRPTAADILLIDDDAMIRALVTKGLARKGMKVIEATGGADGLLKLSQSAFDLVLLDVHMPDMDGFETLRAIRLQMQGREIPIIMLTADDEPRAIETAFEIGAKDFITKPINLRLLEQRIRYAIR